MASRKRPRLTVEEQARELVDCHSIAKATAIAARYSHISAEGPARTYWTAVALEVARLTQTKGGAPPRYSNGACDDCDPSFSCFSATAACCKRPCR
jgi:hypothetical protein